MKKPEVTIYTDGACSPNPGKGGWAALLISREKKLRRELSGSERDSTNNRMELTAVLMGIRALKRPTHVRIITDSQYVKQAFTEGWLENWQHNGWRTAAKKPVKNDDLWRELLLAFEPHIVEWEWVRGHAGNEENNRCDELAVEARLALDP